MSTEEFFDFSVDEWTQQELDELAAWSAVDFELDAPYADRLVLDDEAKQLRAYLDSEMATLLQELSSDRVQAAAHYMPGGGDEIARRMKAIQAELLPRIYAGVRFTIPYLERHELQQTPSWCQIATASNAFASFGLEPVGQDEIAAAVRVTPESRPYPQEVRNFLEDRGLDTAELSSTVQLVDGLVAGARASLNMGYPAYPSQHTVLISGVRIDNGRIDFFVNDSNYDNGAQPMPLERMLQVLEPPFMHNVLNRSFLINKTSENKL